MSVFGDLLSALVPKLIDNLTGKGFQKREVKSAVEAAAEEVKREHEEGQDARLRSIEDRLTALESAGHTQGG